jgi:hypothetical protein
MSERVWCPPDYQTHHPLNTLIRNIILSNKHVNQII